MTEFVKKFLPALTAFTTEKVLPSVIIATIGIFAIRILIKILNKTLERSKLEKTAHSLISSIIRIILFALLGLIIASNLGIDVTGVIALASVASLAISLALQNALTNVFGGFTLLYTRPFSSGDFVQIANQSGTVLEIGLAYTKLLTSDSKTISIPNSTVTAADIVNYSVSGIRRVDITVSASYDAPLDTVMSALLKAADIPSVHKEPAPFTGISDYGDNAIKYILQIWTSSSDYWNTYYTVNKNIKNIFDDNNIEMTYPHLNVHLDK